MKYKKGLLIICLVICLFSIASVWGSDVNNTVPISDNQNDDLVEIDNQNNKEIICSVNSNINDGCVENTNYLTHENINENLSKSYSDTYVKMNINKDVNYGGTVASISINKILPYELNVYIDNSLKFTKQLSDDDFVNNKFHMSFTDKSLGLVPDSSYLVQMTFGEVWSLSENIYINPLENSLGFNSTLSNGKVTVLESYLESSMGENVTLDIVSPKLNKEIKIYIDKIFFKSVSLAEGHVTEIISNLYAGDRLIHVLYDDGINFYVNSFNVRVNKKPIEEFNKMINQIDSGGTLILNEDNVFDTYEINLNKSLTIDGMNHKFGTNLNVNADDVYLKNFIFSDITIKWFGKRGKIENCTLLGSSNKINLQGKQMSLINLNFVRSMGDTGGYDIILNASQAIIEGCSFIGNAGICIYLLTDATDATIEDCYFAQNTGRFIINNYAESTTIKKCTFENNAAPLVYFRSSGPHSSILSSIFINNALKSTSEKALITCDAYFCQITNSILLDSEKNTKKFIYASNPIDASYNWWGNDNNDFSQVLANVGSSTPNLVSIKNWYYLNISSSSTLNLETKSLINYDFYDSYYEKIISKDRASAFPTFNIKTLPINGTSDSIVQIIGGHGQLEFIATKMPTGSLISEFSSFYQVNTFNFKDCGILYTTDLTTYYSNYISFNCIVKDHQNRPLSNIKIRLTLNNKIYENISDEKGIVNFKLNLNPGVYSLKVLNLHTLQTNNNVLTILSTIETPISTFEYHSSTKYEAKFLDCEGNVLSNKKVCFNINNETVYVMTNSKGIAVLDIDLNPGSYKITSINLISGENKLNQLIITPKIINDNDIDIPVLDNGNGVIKLPNDATGTITLNVAGKNYNFDVVNGVSNVKVLELTNGNYEYVLTYSGDEKYSSFTQTGSFTVNTPTNNPTDASTNTPTNTPTQPLDKTTLTLKTAKVKKSAKKLTLQATLKKGNAPIAGVKITFKFNGKKYTAKTNAKGVAKATIKSKVLKKLKVGKKVNYQASYDNIIVKKTVKVKK